MSKNEQFNPEIIEAAHFETGPGEVVPPPPYATVNLRLPSETYTFPMPPAPVPKWVRDGVTRRRETAAGKEEYKAGL